MKYRAIAIAVAIGLLSYPLHAQEEINPDIKESEKETKTSDEGDGKIDESISADNGKIREELAGLVINDKPYSNFAIIQTDGEDVFFTQNEWEEMGINIKGEGLLSAKENGIETTLDLATHSYKLSVPPNLFIGQSFSEGQSWVTSTSKQPKGLFVNYDIASRRSDNGQINSSLGYDARFGIGNGTLVSTGQVNYTDDSGADSVRGVTTYHYDFLEKGLALKLGDVFTPTSPLTSSVNLGGIAIGSDRDLRRGEIYYPVPVISGIAQTNSTAELYVNAVRSNEYNLEPGPFSIDNFPLLTGNNEIQVVIRDEFGRETLLVDNFYYSQENLAKGKIEWGASIGKVREGSSDNYGQLASSAFILRGMSDFWTSGLAYENLDSNYNVSFSNSLILGRLGLLDLNFASSNSNGKSGNAFSGSYSFRADNWSISSSYSQYSQNHWQLSDSNINFINNETNDIDDNLNDDDIPTPFIPDFERFKTKSSANLSLSYFLPEYGLSATLSGAQIKDFSGKDTTRVDLSSSWRVNDKNSISARVSHDLNTKENNAYLTWRYRFDSNLSASLTARPAPVASYAAHMQGKNIIKDKYVQWSGGVTKSKDDTNSYLNTSLDTSKGKVTLDARKRSSGMNYSGRFEGSFWLGEGGLLFQPHSRTSFALIEVPDVEGVPLNNSSAHGIKTNKRGFAIIPSIYPLNPQKITLNTVDLPLEINIQNTSLYATAPRFGGAKVEFVVSSQSIREFLITYQGDVIAPPATVITSNEKTPIGFGGVFYLENASPSDTITVNMEDGSSCTTSLPDELGDYMSIVELECR